MQFGNLRIKKNLKASYMTAFFYPFLFVALMISGYVYRTLSAWQISQTQASVKQIALLFQNILENVHDMSDSLFMNLRVQETLKTEYTSPLEVYNQYKELLFLNDFLTAVDAVDSFRFYTSNQTMLNNAFFVKNTKEIEKAEWYKMAYQGNGKVFWSVNEDFITKKRMLSLNRAIIDSVSGKVLAVLCVNINYSNVVKILSANDNDVFITVDNVIEYAKNKMFDESKREMYQAEKRFGKWEGKIVAFVSETLPEKYTMPIRVTAILPTERLIFATLKGFLFCVALLLVAMVLFLLCIEKLIEDVYRHKIEQAELVSKQNAIRFKMLTSQINPHFLFNTLETIRMQSLAEGSKQSATTIKLLASILRHNLAISDKPINLMEDIKMVCSYLDIQHIRFGERVAYSIMFLCDIRHSLILPQLIQPIIENAFKHGIENNKAGFIYIMIDSDKAGNLIISVKDNGKGMEMEALKELNEKLNTQAVEAISESLGMVNVNQRIKLFYGKQYGLFVESKKDEGTKVTLCIPNVRETGE